jgi:hypothetical protein
MKIISLKYPGKCAETGKRLSRGTIVYFDVSTKKIYSINAKKIKEYFDYINTQGYIEAQENAYFDKFISLNYSNFDK